MRISTETIAQWQNFLTERAEKAKASGQMPLPTDKGQSDEPIVLSAQVQLVLMLHELVQKMSEVDMERVNTVAEQLSRGDYNPDVRTVAESILNEMRG